MSLFKFVLREYFWELLRDVLFSTPSKFWHGSITRILGLYFLGTLGDALMLLQVSLDSNDESDDIMRTEPLNL